MASVIMFALLMLLIIFVEHSQLECPPTDYSGSSGYIVSPNFPDVYDNYDDCTYRIKVLPENYVQLAFYQFDTEGCCDFLYIYKGSAMDNLIASGNKAIGALYNSSNDNTMTLRFTSDQSTVASGFFAIYTSIPNQLTPTVGTNICPPDVYTGSYGIIASPNWPDLYPNNINCHYLISVNSGTMVSLFFNSFKTEACCDILMIYDGASSSAPLIARLSGDSYANRTYTSSQSQMFINFTTDLTTQSSGFSATYRTAR